jgi:hypothetical protein
MRMPQFYFICFFFVFCTVFTEMILHWTNLYMTEVKERKQEI